MDIHSYEHLNLEAFDYVEPSTPHPMTSRSAERRQMHSMYVTSDLPKPVTSSKSNRRKCRMIHLLLTVATCIIAVIVLILLIVFIRIKKNEVSSESTSSGEVSSNAGGFFHSTEIKVQVIADGCCSYTNSLHLSSVFFIDGYPICLSWGATYGFYRRGFNFAVFDLPRDGRPRLESCRTFDTWLSVDEDSKMMHYMREIPAGRLVLVSSIDEAANNFSNKSRELMQRFIGMSPRLRDIGSRDSFALVGYTKANSECYPSWVQDFLRPYDNTTDDGPFVSLEVSVTSHWSCKAQ